MQINDEIYSILGNLGYTGSYNDRWTGYLRSLMGSGTPNDMLNKYLDAIGYTGSLTDKWNRFLGGKPFLPLPNTSLDFVNQKYAASSATSVQPKGFDELITFSRSSNATVTDSNGNIVYAPHNLVTFSEQFDNSAWTKNGSNLSANVTVAPDGMTTADKVIEDTQAAFFHRITRVFTGIPMNSTLASAIYVRAAERARFTITLFNNLNTANNIRGTYNLATQTASASNQGTATGASASLTSVGNGWFRVSISGIPDPSSTSTECNWQIRMLDNSGSDVYNGDGVSGLFIWGAQLNQGSLQPYYPTTVKNLLGFSEAFENAAWTKSNSFIQTNLLTFSEQFDNAAWTKNLVTITANSNNAPNGTLTSDKIIATAVNGAHNVAVAISVTSGLAYTYSFYAKAGEYQFAGLLFAAAGFGTNTIDIFNLSSGTVSTNASGSATITPVGNGWYRCSTTRTASATAASTFQMRVLNAAGGSDYTGDGTSGIFLWGAQLVQGASAGDYVQTTSTSLPVMYQAPNGTMTADKLVEDTANAQHHVRQAYTTTNQLLTLSVYAKAAERNRIFLQLSNNATGAAGVQFDLVNGVAGTPATGGDFTNVSASIVPIGNGWFRCSLTALKGSANSAAWPYLSIADSSGNVSYTGNGTSGIYIWGAQLSDSASLDTYVNNPVAAPSSTAFYGARFDYDPVTRQPRGLLIEEARTNLVLNSGFAGAVGGSPGTAPTSWTIGFGTGAQTSLVTSIYGNGDGAQAVKFDADATERIMYQQSISVTSGVQYAFSVELEAVSGSIGDLLAVTSGTATVTQNTFVTNPSTAGRRTILFTATGTGTVNLRVGIGTTAGAPNTCSCTVSRCQVEAGSFATSYIPTTTATVTRSADVAVIQGTNFSSWYNNDTGTVLAEFTGRTSGVIANISNGTFSNRLPQMAIGSANGYESYVVSGGSVTATLIPSGTHTYNTYAKFAVAYQVNNCAASANGSAVASATSVALPAGLSQMDIGSFQNNSSKLNGWIRRINYYNRRLDNSQLQAITQ